MKEKLLNYLVCPNTGSPLNLEIDEYDKETDEVKTGSLTSRNGTVYPIKNYIPRFVSTDDYTKSFSLQWNLHKTTQYATKEKPLSKEMISKISNFASEEINGKLILDAGCGSGRFIDILEKWGAEVVGVDLSYAVDAAAAVLGRRKNVHLVQASVFALPFRENLFDYIWSFGVLMATPDTRKAFESLVPHVKKHGEIAIWIYSNYNRVPTLFSNILRTITTRLPKKLLYALCYISVPLYYVYKIPLIGLLLRNTCVISMRENWRWRILETFDWYSPKYQWKHRYPEVFEWFKSNGLEVIHMSEPPVGMVGKKL